MTYQHFVKINQTHLTRDLAPENNLAHFYQNCPLTNEYNLALEHLKPCLENELCIRNYWCYKLNKYFELYQDCIYPLVFSTSNLVSAIDLKIYNINSANIDGANIDGANIKDTIYFYYPNFTIELEIISIINSGVGVGANDKVRLDVSWYVKNGNQDQINTFLEILNKDDVIDRLGNESELWKLLDDEGWIQRDLIKPVFRN